MIIFTFFSIFFQTTILPPPILPTNETEEQGLKLSVLRKEDIEIVNEHWPFKCDGSDKFFWILKRRKREMIKSQPILID